MVSSGAVPGAGSWVPQPHSANNRQVSASFVTLPLGAALELRHVRIADLVELYDVAERVLAVDGGYGDEVDGGPMNSMPSSPRRACSSAMPSTCRHRCG